MEVQIWNSKSLLMESILLWPFHNPSSELSRNMFTSKEMPIPQSASAVFSAYASFATTMMLVRSVTNELLPPKFISFLSSIFSYLFGSVSSQTKFIIEENCGVTANQVFQATEIYLRTKIGPSTDTLKITKTFRQKKLTFSIHKDQEITDHFNKIRLQWRFVCSKDKRNEKKRHFELTFAKKFGDTVVDEYLPYVMRRAREIQEEEKVIKIYSQECQFNDDYDEGGRGSCGRWGYLNFDHPATFDTVAMDPELKESIIEDLNRFVRRKDFYRKVGKAWKRGYLLFGPPGTGKSSLIAAMANYLKFDIYDLDLSSVYTNNDLKRAMLSTTNRSILVIEDIDCSIDLQNRQSDEEDYGCAPTKITLSGMLNFIDGLWSSCGDERIIIFTTNHKERLDPALLRPGRMDVHINMSYCSRRGFGVLASNYLGEEATQHRLYGEIEDLIRDMEVSPAEIAEELMKSDDLDVALQGLFNFLKRKKEEQTEAEERPSEKNDHKEEEDQCLAAYQSTPIFC
ncbi:AAA-ATPase At2g18193-like [Momordica charantia]|uniref:AAA-ATPase At2g18193-like n=1 Tax=Momordica charantia TaxID=3673 RepID=A0A6J1BTN9_MOMCH|nr:AAA-ATPase At2g18193-like [Momordica charantia]